MNAQFVTADKMKTLEQYGASLLSSMISLQTLESFHIEAYKKGLLEEDEEECSKTICWEIRRLMALYKHQIESVMERTQLDESTVLDSLKQLMPDIKIPKKKKVKDEAG